MHAIRLSGQKRKKKRKEIKEKERNKGKKKKSTRRQLLVVVILLDTAETDLTSHLWLFIRDHNAVRNFRS